MALSLANLDTETRRHMIAEIEFDVSMKKLYLSKRLSKIGNDDYFSLLGEAAQTQNDLWLAEQLKLNGRINQTEERRKPKGGIAVVAVPVTASETLAEGEFNIFYIRGLCQRAIGDGVKDLIVYRAKQVERPRLESEQKIGLAIDAKLLLADLRENVGVDTALGLPPGPNSGLSMRLP